MRPVNKGNLPITYTKYENYKKHLVENIGDYCSYCERRIPTLLAVEHKKPKDSNPHLECEWDNLLLSCVNCNSAKGDEDINLNDYFFPDRDNTFPIFTYYSDGEVIANNHIENEIKRKVENTIELFGLNKNYIPHRNWIKDSLIQSALERWGQRLNTFEVAHDSLNNYRENQTLQMANQIGKTAKGFGFFSIWMKVFQDYPDVKNEIISAFKGTATDCFDSKGDSISPRPGGLI
ncbi:MAG: TIGR02646 family protein [Leptospiraceae bacterium]|nr:TIGR02646 family protein [Leptospiraceae bacterium]